MDKLEEKVPSCRVEGYFLLDQDKADDTVVAFYHEQEYTHYCHMINKERYEQILSSPIPSEAFGNRIVQLLNETNERLEEVGAIIAATVPQLPSQERIEAALLRLKEDGAIK